MHIYICIIIPLIKITWKTLSYNWDKDKSNCTVHLENNIFNLKKVSILCHQTQDPPINTKDKKRFVDIVSEYNYSLDIFEEYQEKFKVLSIDEFQNFKWV